MGMKFLKLSLICIFVLSAKVVLAKKNGQLKSDVKFDAHSVNGKYQVPLEALAVVENDKTIDDLIGVRKNFQDRIQSSKELR